MQSNEKELTLTLQFSDWSELTGHLKGILEALRLALINATENDPPGSIQELAWSAGLSIRLVSMLEQQMEQTR